MSAPDCPHCGQPSELVTGRLVYPHRVDLWEKRFYRCAPCKAHVGCHPGTGHPLGQLANAELRKLRSAAHAAFDPLWRGGRLSRSETYSWLSRTLDVPPEKCHIGEFDKFMCRKVIVACAEIMGVAEV